VADATDPHGHWSDPEMVERFAAREPDVRLTELLGRYEDPAATRVLDLGCAGGRNTELLARRGFDVVALDVAPAMREAVRARLAPVVGEAEATRRVLDGEMRDLSRFADGTFDLVVALGVFHQARSRTEWDEALTEAARVLAPGGRILISNFAPGTSLGRRPGREPFLHAKEDLEADLASVGLEPDTETKVVVKEENDRRRVVVNALYRKPV
jgi:SAM-dependent methyltransferase